MPPDAVVKFTDVVDGVFKLAALALVAYVLIRLLPTMRERGFTANIFGTQISLHGPQHAIETVAETFKKQVDDLRAHIADLERPAERPRPARPQVGPFGGGSSVLWVDDNPTNNVFEVGKLLDAKVAVKQVRTTREAIEAIRERPYDLVVTDMARTEDGRERPEAGIDLLDRLRAQEAPGRPVPPVILYCSGWAVKTLGHKATEHGAAAVTASTTELLDWVLAERSARPA
jgi:CheY-like chemotaxis protein